MVNYNNITQLLTAEHSVYGTKVAQMRARLRVRKAINTAGGTMSYEEHTALNSLLTLLEDKLGMRKQAVKSNNNHMMKVKNVTPVHLNELGLGGMNWQLIGIENTPVKYNGVDYFPISMTFDPGTFYPHSNNTFCLVAGAKRIQAEYIKSKLLDLLKHDFPGEYQLVSGRYLFRFNYLQLNIIERIIKACKVGDGTVLDYSWIAPLQELKFRIEDTNAKQAQGKPVAWSAGARTIVYKGNNQVKAAKEATFGLSDLKNYMANMTTRKIKEAPTPPSPRVRRVDPFDYNNMVMDVDPLL